VLGVRDAGRERALEESEGLSWSIDGVETKGREALSSGGDWEVELDC
jgi:hypothetical protein